LIEHGQAFRAGKLSEGHDGGVAHPPVGIVKPSRLTVDPTARSAAGVLFRSRTPQCATRTTWPSYIALPSFTFWTTHQPLTHSLAMRSHSVSRQGSWRTVLMSFR
jgi:hypothetical protein